MRILNRQAWLTAGCLLAVSSWAQAQCITLEQLLNLSAISREPLLQRAARQLPATEWTYRGNSTVGKEVFWTYKDPVDGYVRPDGHAEAWLGVRPETGTQAVTLKTSFPACINQLRASLRLYKLKQQPITCHECEAVRYESPQFIVDIYNRKNGPYPFIIVVRHVPTGPTAPREATTSVSGAQ
ncbi:hypothetical protein [Hymenobacter weizhouensis]|uniref:hypothetical protein n=1 Tax=Hymenobacter sp. YIM 151500-1 TaxID=2987689 RepID=UPI002227456D|nr:hypothetical protein [Hymenobacter sp. YIM 151500-1]UYZ62380.1 hypothetical protein OIS53_15440 [Hymenobacter sp. YIM 151500-1]